MKHMATYKFKMRLSLVTALILLISYLANNYIHFMPSGKILAAGFVLFLFLYFINRKNKITSEGVSNKVK